MARRHMDDPIAEEAIEWMVLLRSGEATQNDYDEYRRWRYENPLHERACQRIERTLGKFQPLLAALPHEPIRQALLAPSSRRKVLQYGLGMVAVASLSSLLLNQHYPLSPLLSDVKTATAQRQQVPLSDGSMLMLNARTAVDINVRPETPVRQVALHNGGIFANIQPDTQRPFVIATGMGDIVALQANVNVRYESGGIHVGVLDNIAKITNHAGQSLRLHAGQGVWLIVPRSIKSPLRQNQKQTGYTAAWKYAIVRWLPSSVRYVITPPASSGSIPLSPICASAGISRSII
ncbi:hypothetical protein PEC730217_00950 [Pectobacterium carotovorum subsp. carotovorum]|nr:hypothetical protein PEC730217_00950 [Pectobacterium carotovorum subsp. carotovorum]